MSSDRSSRNRAVTMWAEKGFKVNGYIKNNIPDTEMQTKLHNNTVLKCKVLSKNLKPLQDLG